MTTKLAAIPKKSRTLFNLIRIREISMDLGCPEARAETTLALVVIAPNAFGSECIARSANFQLALPTQLVDNRRYMTPITLS